MTVIKLPTKSCTSAPRRGRSLSLIMPLTYVGYYHNIPGILKCVTPVDIRICNLVANYEGSGGVSNLFMTVILT